LSVLKWALKGAEEVRVGAMAQAEPTNLAVSYENELARIKTEVQASSLYNEDLALDALRGVVRPTSSGTIS
jgi:hypothetical protein